MPPEPVKDEDQDEAIVEFETTEEVDAPWVEFEGEDYYADLIGDSAIGEDAKLTAEKRRGLSKSQFADPENRAYPVMDAAHARAALQRFSQFGRRKYKGAKKASVLRRILSAAKRFGIAVSDAVRKRLGGDSLLEVEEYQKVYSKMRLEDIYAARQLMRRKFGDDAIEEEPEWLVSQHELERRRQLASS